MILVLNPHMAAVWAMLVVMILMVGVGTGRHGGTSESASVLPFKTLKRVQGQAATASFQGVAFDCICSAFPFLPNEMVGLPVKLQQLVFRSIALKLIHGLSTFSVGLPTATECSATQVIRWSW